jgi:hypothetical protein
LSLLRFPGDGVTGGVGTGVVATGPGAEPGATHVLALNGDTSGVVGGTLLRAAAVAIRTR